MDGKKSDLMWSKMTHEKVTPRKASLVSEVTSQIGQQAILDSLRFYPVRMIPK